jgi:multidrug efflux pump subunit AcrA (membrane-fusion protein)
VKKLKHSIIIKKGKRKWIIITAISITIVSLSFGSVYVMRQQNNQVLAAEESSVQTVTASQGDIETTVAGTGSITYDAAGDIEIPVDLEFDEIYVASGDVVKAGDDLAKVSGASVAKALAKVQEEIKTLDTEIGQLDLETETTYLTTQLAGRVKAIYGAANDMVSDIMLKNGAMIILSLDGYMAVDVSTSAKVTVNDSVTVTLSDGNTVTGTVSAVANKKCTILLTDDGTALNDKVTVTDSSGEKLGSGKLYIHKPHNIVGTSGSISSVDVSLNESVAADAQLMTLSETGQSYEYLALLEERQEQETKLQQLLTIAKTNKITAEFDGLIETINISADTTTNNTSTDDTSTDNTKTDSTAAEKLATINQFKVTQLTSTDTPDDTNDDSELPSAMLDASFLNTFTISAPQIGTEIPTSIAETEQYSGEISWQTNDVTFLSETVYSANITLTAKTGYYFDPNIQLQYDAAAVSGLSVNNTDTSSVISFTLTFPATEADPSDLGNDSDDTTDPVSNEETETEKDTDTTKESNTEDDSTQDDDSDTEKETTDNNNTSKNNSSKSTDTSKTKNDTESTNDTSGDEKSSDTGQGSRSPNTSTGGSGSSTSRTPTSTSTSSSNAANSNSSETAETAESEDSSTMTAFTISKQDNVIITINVDELDILSVKEGQNAEITLDAIEGEVFNGVITNISTATSEGTTNYTAEITLEKTENMLAGMTASAAITVSDAKDVIKLPINALQERGSKTYVYTKYDEESGELSGEVEIETGLSDGDYVEVVSGLTDGDEVYFMRTGNSSSSSSSERRMMNGEMPSFSGDFSPGDFGSGSTRSSGSSGGPTQRTK